MLMEERKDVVIFKGSDEEVKRLKEEMGLVRGDGVCIMAADAPKKVYRADVPSDAFYKEKIAAQAKRIQELEEELKESRRTESDAVRDLHQAEQRILKLESAFIEAAIK